MKVEYGSSIPPAVAGDSFGEVRIRIERLVLDKDALAEGRDGWELDNCVVEPVWWGAAAAAAAPAAAGGGGRSRPRAARCTPSTPETSRGVTCLVFPVKTQRDMLELYFQNMKYADEGLTFNIIVPAASTGTRRDALIGAASARLDTLTPRTPVAGWFTVVGASSSGSAAIGKLKLHIAVSYFDVANRAKSAPPTRAGAKKNERHHEVAAPEEEPAAHDQRDPEPAAVAGMPTATPPSTTPTAAKPTKPPTAQAATAPPPLPTNATADHSAAKASQNANALPVSATAQPVPPPKIDASLPPAPTVNRTFLPGYTEHIDHVFRRGLEMREAMARAAGASTLAGVGPIDSAASARLASAFTRYAPRDAPAPNLLDPLQFARHDDDDEVTDSDSDGSRSGSSSCLSSLSSSYAEHGAHESPMGDRLHHSPHHVPAHHGRPQPRLQAAAAAPAPNSSMMVRDPSLFKIVVHRASLAARAFEACQFALRVSRDVLFSEPPPDPIWSACFELPMAGADGGSFALPVVAFAATSKLVIEVYGVSHSRRELSMLGIAILPLCAARHDTVDFRNPSTSTVEAQAAITVDKRPLVVQRAGPAAQGASETPQQVEGSGNLATAQVPVRSPAADKTAPIDEPQRAAHVMPKNYRVVDAPVGLAQAAPTGGEAATSVAHRSASASYAQPFHSAADYQTQAHRAAPSAAVPPVPTQALRRDRFDDDRGSSRADMLGGCAREGYSGVVMRITATELSDVPRVKVEGVDSAALRLVIAVDRVSRSEGDAIDDWTCATDCFVEESACALLKGSAKISMRSELRFGHCVNIKDIAALRLRVFAHAAADADATLEFDVGNAVTSAEMLQDCIDIGEVGVDLRFHTRYGGPVIDGWYRVTRPGGVAAGCVKINVSVADRDE